MSEPLSREPTVQELETAWRIVRDNLSPSPVMPTTLANNTFLKLETFQPTGSFKVRGALAETAALPEGCEALTASAGNHGLGVAFAAERLKRAATVVVPRNAATPKVEALRGFSITLLQEGHDIDAAEAYALQMDGADYQYLSPYDNAWVIAGQSTIGRELDTQISGPMTVVCGVGGGGLCAGIALWASRHDDVTVIGVESAQSRAMSTAIAIGHVVEIEVGDTIADGLAGNLAPGCVTPTVIAEHVERLVAVEDDEIRSAMLWLYRHHGLVVEPSGAVGIAAVLNDRIPITGTLVVVLSGRNVAPEKFAAIIATDPTVSGNSHDT